MYEQDKHMNPWLEKLEQVSVPSADGSWTGMQILLNTELPVSSATHIKRWMLLVICLLLVLGICNCPGKIFNGKVSQENNTSHTDQERGGENQFVKKETAATTQPPDKNKKIDDHFPNSPEIHSSSDFKYTNDNDVENSSKGAGTTTKHRHFDKNYQKNRTDVYTVKKEQAKDRSDKEKTTFGPEEPIENTSENVDSISKQKTISQGFQKDSAFATKKILNDSSSNRITKSKEKNNERGWTFGVGVNQFLPINGQQTINYNSGGTRGVVTDYIPVPTAKYYFNHKLYFQGELQFNAPQYTKKIWIYNFSNSIQFSRAFVGKLYYFNVPLSVHFSPIRNLFVGTGLQYSRLTNALAVYENGIVSANGDSVESSIVRSIKNDSLYYLLSKSEWKLLFDLNYQWKQFTFGIQYKYALTSFMDTKNNSLQLYLRYMIWDRRRKKSSPK